MIFAESSNGYDIVKRHVVVDVKEIGKDARLESLTQLIEMMGDNLPCVEEIEDVCVDYYDTKKWANRFIKEKMEELGLVRDTLLRKKYKVIWLDFETEFRERSGGLGIAGCGSC